MFGGHSIIAENGSILKEAKRFCNQAIYSEIDVQRVIRERRQNTTFRMRGERTLVCVPFDLNIEKTELTRRCSKYPFVPPNELLRANRCEEILTIQAMGLKKTSGAHSCVERRCRYFGRFGLYAGTDRDGAGV